MWVAISWNGSIVSRVWCEAVRLRECVGARRVHCGVVVRLRGAIRHNPVDNMHLAETCYGIYCTEMRPTKMSARPPETPPIAAPIVSASDGASATHSGRIGLTSIGDDHCRRDTRLKRILGRPDSRDLTTGWAVDRWQRERRHWHWRRLWSWRKCWLRCWIRHRFRRRIRRRRRRWWRCHGRRSDHCGNNHTPSAK
jgi:hypothetical protein